MRPRQGITELFSTFLEFDADRVRGWATDPRLRRSMERCLSQSSTAESSADFWGIYWHKRWQTEANRLAQSHLTAYLQEPCYWAAQKATTRFESSQYRLSDCFQVAITYLEKILQGFDASRNLSLKGYASFKFSSAIKDMLRQRRIADICTPWALLNKLSKKRLTESLQTAGLMPDIVQRYSLAWVCYNALYVPTEVPTRTATTRKLLKPEPETWAAIANLYNQQRQTQLPPDTPVASPTEIEAWMTFCATAARQYLYPATTSINAPKPGQEDGELLDTLPETYAAPALDSLIAQEEATQANQINAVLFQAIDQLAPELKQLLQLYYIDGLTQQQIAQQLQIQQYTISRQLSRIKRSLQRQLVEWSQDTLHIAPTLDVLESMSAALDEWLNTHYSQKN
jgi:RNA polymerase sigma factor (sigma-70 family)